MHKRLWGGMAGVTLAALMGALGSYAIFSHVLPGPFIPPDAARALTAAHEPCSFVTVSTKGYKFISPILYSEPECPDPSLDPLRDSISAIIGEHMRSGDIRNAAVYFRDMSNDEWTVVNDSAQFLPGVQRRMPVLITYLRMAERMPDLFERQLRVDGPPRDGHSPFLSEGCEEIVPGRSYSVRELIESDMRCSDDLANAVLLKNVDRELFDKTVDDLRGNDGSDPEKVRPVTVRRYATALNALYNGHLLSLESAQYAISLLVGPGIRTGLVSGVPSGMKVARRFAALEGDDGSMELHECGLFYSGQKPYMLSILAQGKDMARLPGVVAHISSFVYQYRVRTTMSG